MSQKALLAGFLSVWLKKCVISSPPHDEILSWVLLLAVQLIHGKPLRLLLAIVYGIQHDLRALTEAFCRQPATKRGKGQILPRDGPNPRVELPYTYLMHGSHCIILPLSNLENSLQKVYASRIFIVLRGHNGSGHT